MAEPSIPLTTERVSSWASTSIHINKVAFVIEGLPEWSLDLESYLPLNIADKIQNGEWDTPFPQLSSSLRDPWHGYTVTINTLGTSVFVPLLWEAHPQVLGKVATICGNRHNVMLLSAQHSCKWGVLSLCLPTYTSWSKSSLNADGLGSELAFYTHGF